MGCDIHMFVEKRTATGWEFSAEIDVDKNYTLFSVLANVRNGYGFALVDTGDPVAPIAMPKGFPSDGSSFVRKEYLDWGGDAHSASWFTVAELLNYNWNRPIVKRGIVSMKEYDTYKRTGKPQSWCGDCSGSNIKHISNSEMDTLIAQGGLNETTTEIAVTKIQWEVHLDYSCKSFVHTTLPKLKALCKTSDYSDVRVVFWFDN